MAPARDQPLTHLPLLQVGILQRHRVWIPADTRFRSAARLLQALYREEQNLPIGSYVNEHSKREKLGSRIALKAANAGANFLNPQIFHLTLKEVAYREVGALFDIERLATNLLSSSPLVFNLLGPWQGCLERAQGCLLELIPTFEGTPTALLFEHSPGRGDPQFTQDFTAFDALVRFTDAAQRSGFIAIEVKLTEAMVEPIPAHKPRYNELSALSGLFHDHAAPALRASPLNQLWREHMLAQAMIDVGDLPRTELPREGRG